MVTFGLWSLVRFWSRMVVCWNEIEATSGLSALCLLDLLLNNTCRRWVKIPTVISNLKDYFTKNGMVLQRWSHLFIFICYLYHWIWLWLHSFRIITAPIFNNENDGKEDLEDQVPKKKISQQKFSYELVPDKLYL